MKKVYFKTFGCRTNIYDTDIMKNSLEEHEIVESEEEADIVVVNSCTVTNSADSRVRSYSKKQTNDGKRVVIAGCGAMNRGAELQKNGFVDSVLGHSNKENLGKLLSHTKFYEVGDLTSIEKKIVTTSSKSKAFIKIQEGCDFNCSYCIIPSVRGRTRSQDESFILEQIKILADNNYSEFVLTGTNIGSYGKEYKTSLAKLLKKIVLIRGVKRVRLGSIEPCQIDDEFLEIVKNPIIERHLHVALQHTNEKMLKIMKRRNSYKDDYSLLFKLRDLGFAIGTDFIVGHPGESEEIYEDAKEKLKDLPLTHIHLFSYSKRDGTHAASLGDIVNGDIANKRLKVLEKIIDDKNYAFRKENKDNFLNVFVENKYKEYYVGYDQFFNKIYITSKEDIVGKWIVINNYEVKADANYK